MKRHEAIRRATAIFQKDEHKRIARRLVRLNLRMLDYIMQAPVIVPMLEPRVSRLDDAGVVLDVKDPLLKRDIRASLLLFCQRGAKLRDVLEFLDINTGLRGLPPGVGTRNQVMCFRGYNASTIAQQIAKRTPGECAWFLSFIEGWCPPVVSTGWPMRDWMIQHLPLSQPTGITLDIGHITDLFRARPEWKPHWKWRDLAAHMRKWEESYIVQNWDLGQDDATLTAIAALQQGQLQIRQLQTAPPSAMTMQMLELYQRQLQEQAVAVFGANIFSRQDGKSFATGPLSPHTFTDEWVCSVGKFVRLNTAMDLALEGKALSHCVGDYAAQVQAGTSVIYSLREHSTGKPLATLEMIKTGETNGKPTWWESQFRGYRNSQPRSDWKAAAKEFQVITFAPLAPPRRMQFEDDLHNRNQRDIYQRREFQVELVQLAMQALGIDLMEADRWEATIHVSVDGRSIGDVMLNERIQMPMPITVEDEQELARMEIKRPRREVFPITRAVLHEAERRYHHHMLECAGGDFGEVDERYRIYTERRVAMQPMQPRFYNGRRWEI